LLSSAACVRGKDIYATRGTEWAFGTGYMGDV